jgi:type I restriction-modification system DNA methylase subunit
MNEKELKNEIKELIDKYNEVVEKKKIRRYNEEMTKKDFILPLFEILGWNVYNKPKRNNTVSAEEKISKKRVDYGFRINGIPKFYLEAKALGKDLDNPKFIGQAINYAWYKGCTWAVLTDFEQIKIFNAEWKTTHPIHNLLKSIACYEFLDRFDELWLLSKEKFEQGLLDKEAEKWGKKTKKTPVDKQLLTDFTRFRELLSKNITKLNQDKHLTEEELDESVQRILDRLIFIRNCEDKGLEEKKLWEAKNETKVLKKLREIFSYYDENYNSKLFTFDPRDSKKIHLCDILVIDNDVLKEIIELLYQTKDLSLSYDFSAIEADVLGNIYEQYLGHILKKSKKRAKITSGKTHRKEQGIYYTPTYIVDYIVRNTLGEILKKRGIRVDELKILDPACGSGSFLIKAFDVFNEYWKKKDKHYSQARFDITGKGITFTRKVKILENNIFGVDLDRQAVEIAQLNLLLKIAEKGHRLPLLQQNIKCGNSLIDEIHILPDKAFKWEEQYKEIMENGGFDVIIGNPPWGADFDNDEKDFLSEEYCVSKQNINSFELFLRKLISLLNHSGVIGFLIPRNFIRSLQYSETRKKFLDKFLIHHVIDFKKFPEVTQECVAIIASKNEKISLSKRKRNLIDVGGDIKIPQGYFLDLPNYVFNLNLTDKKFQILKKLLRGMCLKDVIDVVRGEEISKRGGIIKCPNCSKWSVASKKEEKVCPNCEEKFIVEDAEKRDIISEEKIESYSPILIGEDFIRYRIIKKHYVNLNVNGIKSKKKSNYQSPKLVMMAVSPFFIISYDKDENILLTKNNFSIRIKENTDVDLRYIMAILNSKLYRFYQDNLYTLGAEITIFISQEYLKTVRILNPKNFDTTQKNLHLDLIKNVDKILELNSKINKIGLRNTDMKNRFEEKIIIVEEKIDSIVYKLYGLAKEEIVIVEESLKK